MLGEADLEDAIIVLVAGRARRRQVDVERVGHAPCTAERHQAVGRARRLLGPYRVGDGDLLAALRAGGLAQSTAGQGVGKVARGGEVHSVWTSLQPAMSTASTREDAGVPV